ncbi:hypothetical protein [Reichenbachiella versicolor]|uniref:hypothetical protein n=1 Tax=Reichenbachiella versicolor TaxID=1821036 RepID=UPI000D6E0F11|nr:hypothetical protein [Reichenbachiella versicolor]
MKKIRLILSICALFALGACEETSLEPENFQDVGWMTSHNASESFQIDQVGGTAGFMNVSQNPIEMRWEVDSGVFFLEGSISNAEISEVKNDRTILEKYIVEREDTTSNATTINVFFSRANPEIQEIAGVERRISKVRLFNSFKDSVVFRGRTDVGTVWSDSLNAWFIEREWLIDVYDSVAAQFELYKDGTLVYDNYLENEYDSLITQEIFEGESLLFKDRTVYDRPDNAIVRVYDWSDDLDQLGTALENVQKKAYHPDPAKDQNGEIPVDFNKEGTYLLQYVVKRNADNETDVNHEKQRRAAQDSLYVPVKVVVKPSIAPFSINKATEESEYDGTVSTITLSTVVAMSEIAGDVTGNFTLSITGGASFNPTAVSLANDDDGLPTLLNLTFNYDFDFATEVVKISYDGSGNIVSSNSARTMEAWSDLKVSLYDPNVLAQAGWDWEFKSDGAGWPNPSGAFFTFTNNLTGDPVASVSSGSLNISLPATGASNSQTRFKSNISEFPYTLDKTKSYRITYDYRYTGNDGDLSLVRLRWLNSSNASQNANSNKMNNASPASSSDFQSWSIDFPADGFSEVAGDVVGLEIQMNGVKNTSAFTLEIDNIRVFEIPTAP